LLLKIQILIPTDAGLRFEFFTRLEFDPSRANTRVYGQTKVCKIIEAFEVEALLIIAP